MTVNQETIESLAARLEGAELDARDLPKVTDDFPSLSIADAYDVQWAIRRRKEQRGSRIVGMKMGLTSRSKMEQMGVSTPIYGFLTDYFECSESGEIEISELIHPKVEAEIAFFTKAPIRGPGCHIGNVLAATDFVLPALEIIDSRYRDFKFDLVSVIADNASSSRFVTGGISQAVEHVDLKTLGVVMEKNGQVVATGAGAAVLGHPATSIAMLANMLAERGEEIPAGSLLLSGAITEAVAVQRGESVSLRAQGLGSFSIRFV